MLFCIDFLWFYSQFSPIFKILFWHVWGVGLGYAIVNKEVLGINTIPPMSRPLNLFKDIHNSKPKHLLLGECYPQGLIVHHQRYSNTNVDTCNTKSHNRYVNQQWKVIWKIYFSQINRFWFPQLASFHIQPYNRLSSKQSSLPPPLFGSFWCQFM